MSVPDGACLVGAELNGGVAVPGGLVVAERVATLHRPALEGEEGPYAGHLMVCPRRHVPDFAALDGDEAAEVGGAIRLVSRALKELGAERVYMLTIGHGVPHLHVHLLPRWPETPPGVAWHAVDEWEGARRASSGDAEEIMTLLRSAHAEAL